MRTLKISLLVFILSITISSQWYQQNSGTTEWLSSVWMIDSSKVITVGSGGTILITTDAGASWHQRNSSTTAFLNDVFFVDANSGTAVGDSGIILQTTDGGENWNQRASGDRCQS